MINIIVGKLTNMPAIIKHNYRLQNARDFIEHFNDSLNTASPRNHYLFVGKPTPWGQSITNELNPPIPTDSLIEDRLIWEEMLALKKIDDTRVSLVVPRSDWDITGSTIYAPFDDKDQFLYEQPTATRSNAVQPGQKAGNFYVITDNFDLFVCVANGNNSVSTIKPIRPVGVVTNLIDYTSQDGYVWKYLASLKQADILKYATDSWIPVKTLLADDDSSQWDVQQAAISERGKIISVIIDNAGTGYTNTFVGTLSSVSNGGPSGVGIATLNGSPAPSSTNGIYAGAQIHITNTSGPEAGAIYEIASYAGNVITLTAPWATPTNGLSCSILPKITVSHNGTVAPKFRPVVQSGVISRFLILNRGENLTFAKIVVTNSLGGSGASARPVISEINSGLGEDIERDLGAHYVMLNSRLEYNEGSGDFPVNNDYRQIGIIRNVRNYGSSALASATTLIATKKLLLQNVSGSPLTFDEIFQVSSTGPKAIIIDYIPNLDPITGNPINEGTLTYIQNETTEYLPFSAAQNISGTQTNFSATIKTSGIVNEEVNKGFGEILYIENRRAVLRSIDQIEDIKAIIEF